MEPEMGSTLEADARDESPAHRHLLVSLWGKGGVGKSTLSAALAYSLRRRGLRVALVSTDVLPTLLDVLGGGEPGKWAKLCGLDVLVVTEELASRLWRERFGDEVYRVFSLLFDVDRDTLLEYLSQAPWVLEQLYLAMVVESLEGYDAVVWDTPGAGGGLMMLMLEEKLYRHLRLAPRIYARFRLGGREAIAEVIASWRRLAEEILGALSSPLHKPILVGDVYNPGAVLEVHRYVSRVRSPIAIVLNRCVELDPCPGCAYTAALQELTRNALKLLDKLGIPVYRVPLLAKPPRGCNGVARLSEHIELLADKLLSG